MKALALALMALVITSAVFAQSGSRGGRSRTRSYTLTVESNVRGADVSIDGQVRGQTPLSLELDRADYRVEVSADGYRSYSETVPLSGDREVYANLQAVEYSLNVDPNVDGAQIEIEGKGQARGSMRVTVTPGTYRVTITAPGYDDFTTRVTVRGDQTLRPELTPSTVTVRVVIPDSMRSGGPKDDNDESFTVFIDGDQFTGSTFQVRPGRRDFRIVSGAWAAEGRFVLRPGEEYTLRPSLTLTLEQ